MFFPVRQKSNLSLVVYRSIIDSVFDNLQAIQTTQNNQLNVSFIVQNKTKISQVQMIFQ